jgi:hypothetical protein
MTLATIMTILSHFFLLTTPTSFCRPVFCKAHRSLHIRPLGALGFLESSNAIDDLLFGISEKSGIGNDELSDQISNRMIAIRLHQRTQWLFVFFSFLLPLLLLYLLLWKRILRQESLCRRGKDENLLQEISIKRTV